MLLRTRISFAHVCNQNPLGPAALRVGGRGRLSLGGDRMGRLAPGFPAAARACLVRDRALAGLSAARLLHLWFKFDADAPKSFIEGGGIAASGGIAAMAVAITRSVWRAKEAQNVTTYGSARWADIREVRRAGLLGPDGVVLGRLGGSYLRHDGPEHVLCFAPTRSGKGVGLVIPTLLTWPYSTVVHDIKGENFQLTSGWRARFGSVLLFDPTNPASAAYNPLLEIRKGDCEVRDAQ